MPSGKFSAAGIKVQRPRHERVQSDNVFKPSLPSPTGHSAHSFSPESIKDANEAIKDVSSKRAHDCEWSISEESLGTRLCSKCSKTKDPKIIGVFRLYTKYFAGKNYLLCGMKMYCDLGFTHIFA